MQKAEANKRTLTENFMTKLKPQSQKYIVWDTKQRGLAVLVQPSGYKSWKAIYSFHGRPRWLHIGACDAFGLDQARKSAQKAMYEVSTGLDPAAQKQADRIHGTFAELVTRYISEYAQKKNRAWKQAENTLKLYAIPRLGNLKIDKIARADIKAMVRAINAPFAANAALAATSALFAWAIREDILETNPCLKIERNPTNDRERVLSASEIPLFWKAFGEVDYVQGMALKMILLTGQRPGEVSHMRTEHIKDGWWELPGVPVPELNWPGTKNGDNHRVWLPKAALAILAEMETSGLVFQAPRGGAVDKLDKVMREISAKLRVDSVRPHDLRRTHGTTVTGLGFGRDGMNRVQNHREGGIGSVYDRHEYAEENKRIMETVARKLVSLVDGAPDNVIPMVAA